MTGGPMIRSNPILPTARAQAVTENNDSQPLSQATASAKSPSKSIDDLLRAFSDTAYSAEEEKHPWESWNYSRISAF